MDEQIKIIPAILSGSLEDLLEKCTRVNRVVGRVQVDIVGRAFSADPSVGVGALDQVTIDVALDVQLMVREPISFLNRCDLAGVDRVFGHVEYMHDQQAFIEYASTLGMRVGLAVDLPTPVVSIEEVLADLDAVLLMAVPAGRSGQPFDGRVLQKIAQVKALRPDLAICVDGGITPDTIRPLVAAGATEFAVGSFLWESKDIVKAIGELLEATR